LESKEYKKDYRINIRVSKEEYEQIKRQAKENRMNMTDYLLMLVSDDKGVNHFNFKR
jgi:predicted DNA binding CopG/RHH family protein